MLSLAKPKQIDIQRFLDASREARFTYDQIGATRETDLPAGYNHDSKRIRLGEGRATFQAAVKALGRWHMFPMELTTVFPPSVPIRVGEVVGILFRTPIVWSVSPCRIVYVVDERDESCSHHRFGFAYGTLPGHVESGEEQFLVHWDRGSDEVTYSIVAFSKPSCFLVKLGYPYARLQQARFRRLSAASMRRAVTNSLRRQEANRPVSV